MNLLNVSLGKVDVKKSSGKAILADQRDRRKNRLKQLRSTKQEKVQKQYKHLSTGEGDFIDFLFNLFYCRFLFCYF